MTTQPVDRLDGIETWLAIARTGTSNPPQTDAEAAAYLNQLTDFLGRLLPDVDWLIAEVKRLRKEQQS